jgi:glucose/mannose transport system substrate-binding protein
MRQTYREGSDMRKTLGAMAALGGAGEAAMTMLPARVTAGDPPPAVQMLGFDIQGWADEGALGQLDDVAVAEVWDAVVPAALKPVHPVSGHPGGL